MTHVDVVVVGGGAAGLTAARGLAAQGLSVALLEARDRFGGRIATTQHADSISPLELGAEFVHGRPPEILSLPAAEFALYEIHGETWTARQGHLWPEHRLDESLEGVLEEILAWRGVDRSLASFLDERFPAGRHTAARDALRRYVEGFDAADANTVSIQWLAQIEHAARRIEGSRQFRLSAGYGQVISWLRAGLPAHRTEVRLNAVVHELQWSPGHVLVESHAPVGEPLEPITAQAAVITLPLGVLTAGEGAASVRFVPDLGDKQSTYKELAMGQVLKVVLRFREPFWDRRHQSYPNLPRLSFLFAPDEIFPTWWTSYPLVAPLLTGWLAGPRAAPLAHQTDARIIEAAIGALARSLGVPTATLEGELAGAHLHNWNTDPFARGAYSYVLAGGLEAPKRLGAPLANTLFFAGEATDTEGNTGTVHAAIASGNRVVGEILRRG